MYITLIVKNIIQETHDTITIEFENHEINYLPGQYLLLKIPHNSEILYRAYSLSSSPCINKFPAITIKRVINGKISNYLNDHINVGDKIISTQPKGTFTTEYDINNKRHIVCIAAGSGITPLLSIIKSALHQEPKSRVTLLYINRNEESRIFSKELSEIQSTYVDRLKIFHILTRPSSSWKGMKGRPTKESLISILSSSDILDPLDSPLYDSCEYYLCGPEALMNLVKDTLSTVGINKKQIFWESFGEHITPNKDLINTSNLSFFDEKTTSNVKIKYEDEIYSIEVSKNQTILEAALEEDIDIPFACSKGTCNICQAICKKGKIKMDCDDGLTDDEIDSGYILTCVSRPESKDIEIEIPEDW